MGAEGENRARQQILLGILWPLTFCAPMKLLPLGRQRAKLEANRDLNRATGGWESAVPLGLDGLACKTPC